jgi:two-component system response regulator NreC
MTAPSARIRIVIVDDHAILRAGLQALLEVEMDMEVVGEAATGEEAIRKIRELKPDVAVVDLSMPDKLDGLGAIRRVAALGLDTKMLVLTMHSEEEYLLPVINAGGSGFVRKSRADCGLIEAIRCVARGGIHLTPHATALLIKQHHAAEVGQGAALLARLTLREREVVALTAEGYTAAEIGERLFLSAKTVETYRARAARKLGFTHRSDLVRFALRAGLLKHT